MAFIAKLFINGEERNILNTTILYQQLVDDNGRPKNAVHNGKINFKIESTKNDELFYDWMFSDQTTYSGHVRFYKRDGFSKLFDYEFANCHCIQLGEYFTAEGNGPLNMHLTLSPGIQQVRDQIFEKSWNPSNPFVDQAPITEREDQEPIFLGYHFEDKQEEIIEKEEVEVDDEIFLVIETENATGENMKIGARLYFPMALRYFSPSSGGRSGTIAPCKPFSDIAPANRSTPYLKRML